MIGATQIFLLCIATSFSVAFDFDPLGNPRLALFAGNDLNEALLTKINIDEDNAGFEKPQIFGGRSTSFGGRRLLQEPPLRKRHTVEQKLIREPPLVKRTVEQRLIREPPLKRSFTPIDLVYRFPYPSGKHSRFGPVVIEPVDF